MFCKIKHTIVLDILTKGFKMKKAPLLALITALIATPIYASTTLTIDINDGFQPVLESLKPKLTKQLGMDINIVSKTNQKIYEELNKNQVGADLVLFVENPNYGTPRINQFLSENSQIVAASKVVLWCPNTPLAKRVSLSSTINQSKIKSIAVLPQGTMIQQMFSKSLPNLSKSIQLVTAPTSLAAWRMARNNQVQCAITLDKWLKPTDQFVNVSYNEILLRGYINPNLRNKTQARQVLALLGSPLIQPLMMRSTGIDLAQSAPKRKLSDVNRKAS